MTGNGDGYGCGNGDGDGDGYASINFSCARYAGDDNVLAMAHVGMRITDYPRAQTPTT